MRVTSDVGPWSIVPEWVLDAEVSDRAVRLYAVLARYADKDGESFPSRRTLAARLRCSDDSIDRAVRELVSAGALQIEARATENGDQTTNLYRIIMAASVRHPLRKSAATPLRTGATQNESQLERDTSLAAAPRKRAPNEVWDALIPIFGEPTTRTAQKVRGKVVASLRSAGATGPEILARARRWPLHFDGAVMTDLAFEKHWDTLARKPLRRQ